MHPAHLSSFTLLTILLQRVRRSPYSQNPEFEDAREMTVIMRNWQPKQKRSVVLPVLNHTNDASTLQMIHGDYHQGPELLLRAVNVSNGSLSQMDGANNNSRRFSEGRSFGSHGSQLRARQHVWNSTTERQESPPKRPLPMQYTIPLSNVVVADFFNVHLLHLTTQSHGYFEFSFLSKNARDTMVAFLTASLPPERILSCSSGAASATRHQEEDKWNAPICSFDVETLTNRRIQERVEQETLSEKLKRKVAHVALQIEASEYSSVCL